MRACIPGDPVGFCLDDGGHFTLVQAPDTDPTRPILGMREIRLE